MALNVNDPTQVQLFKRQFREQNPQISEAEIDSAINQRRTQQQPQQPQQPQIGGGVTTGVGIGRPEAPTGTSIQSPTAQPPALPTPKADSITLPNGRVVTRDMAFQAIFKDPKNTKIYERMISEIDRKTKLAEPKKEEKLTDKQTSLEQAKDFAKEALKTFQTGEVSTGPLTTRVQRAKEFIPGAKATAGTKFRSQIALANTVLKNALLGGAITPSEFEGLKDAIPTGNEQEAIVEQKLKTFISLLGGTPEVSKKKVDERQPALDLAAERTPGIEFEPSENLVENIIPSTKQVFSDISQVLLNPIQTLKGIGLTLAGIGEKASKAVGLETGVGRPIDPALAGEPIVDALGEFYKNRYGSLEDAQRTIVQDPAGAMLDLLTVLDLGGTAISKVGTVSKVTKGGKVASVVKAGEMVSNISRKLDPIEQTFKLASKGLKRIKVLPQAEKVVALPGVRKQFLPEVVETAKKLQVELPVSATTKNVFVHSLEALAQRGIFGQKVTRTIEKAIERIDELNFNIVSSVDTAPDLQSVGNVIKEGLENHVDDFNKTKTILYDGVNKKVFKSPAVADNTLEALDNIIANRGKSLIDSVSDFYKDLKVRLSTKDIDVIAEATGADRIIDFDELRKASKRKGKGITVESLKQTRTELGQKLKSTDPFVTGNKADLRRLYATLTNDMDNMIKILDPEAFKALEEANNFYRDNINKINSAVGKKLAKSTPEKIIDNIIKPNTPSDVALFKELVGDEAWSEISSVFMGKIVKDSLGKDGLVNFTKFRRTIDKFGDATIKEVLSTDQQVQLIKIRNQLDDLERLSESIKKGVKPAQGSQTAFLVNIVAALLNPVIMIQMLLGQVGINKLVTTKFGKDLLTKGSKIKIPRIPGRGIAPKVDKVLEKTGRFGKFLQGLPQFPPEL